MFDRINARVLMIVGAVLFSTGGAAIKGTTLSGTEVACLRSGVAFIALMVLVPGCRRGWTPRVALVAISYATTLVLFVQATKLTTSAHAIFLQSTAPLFLLVLAPWLLREPVQRRDIGFMLAMTAGLALLFAGRGDATALAPNPALGNALGAASGLTWALTLLGLRALARDQGGQAATTSAAVGNLFAFVACSFAALPLTDVSMHDVVAVAYLGIVQIALAYMLVTAAMARLTALEASLLVLVEPVFNPVWSWWLHDEWPGTLALVAGGIILVATTQRILSRATAPETGTATTPREQ